MSQHTSDPAHPPSPEQNDSHHDAHLGLRLVLGSILAPKRPQTGSSSVSGTASPFHHWHYPTTGTGTGSGHDSPPLSPPHPTTVLPHHQPHHQQPYHHAHQPTPSPHPHQNQHHHSHAQPQPQPHAHPHAYGPSRLSFTHSTGSTPPESLSPSPTPSPRLATPPLTFDHASHAYPSEHSPVTKAGTATNPADAADPKRAHFLTTLQSKSAWDAMIHGSFV